MHSKSQVERLLQRFRRKIAEVSDLSGHLAENFAGLDTVAAETLGALDDEHPLLVRELRRLVAEGDNAFDRAVALETGLARALAHERLTTDPIDVDDLRRLAALRSLDFAGQLRVVYSLCLGGKGIWQRIRNMEPPSMPEPSLDPVVRALRTLAARADSGLPVNDGPHRIELNDLAPMHRVAVEKAAGEPLGFCRLVIEEAMALLRGADWPNFAPLCYVAELLDDPFLAAVDPVFHADLAARAALYLAEHYALTDQPEHYEHWLESAVPLLAEGTQDPELRALYFEARAARAVRDGRIHRALRGFLRANVLLTESRPVDRRAASLLRYAIVLGHHPGAADRAPLVLETSQAMLASLEPEIHPSLRLRFLHFLAEAEVTGAYRRAGRFLLDDGGCLSDPGGMIGNAWALEAAARDWIEALSAESAALLRAQLHLGAAEGLYDLFGTPALRLRRSWLLGRAQMLSHPELALIYLLDAQSGFEDRGDDPLARLSAADVCASLAFAGRGDDAAAWVEALARRRAPWNSKWNATADALLLLSHHLLPDHGGRETDALLGDLLESRLSA